MFYLKLVNLKYLEVAQNEINNGGSNMAASMEEDHLDVKGSN